MAKDLGRDPWIVLGVLHTIGFDRYKSPEDMVPDTLIDKVKRAFREGVSPVVLERPADEPSAAAAPSAPSSPKEADWMAKLVPGVVRAGATRTATKPEAKPAASRELSLVPAAAVAPAWKSSAEDERVAAQRATVGAERAGVAAEREAVEAQRELMRLEGDALEDQRRSLVATLSLVEASRSDLERTRVELERLRGELERVRRAPASAGPGPAVEPGAPLVDLLHARGLRGHDEFERAFGALAAARWMGELLPRLRTDDPVAVSKWLSERLVLVSGASTAPGAVSVAPDRAEVPDAAEAAKRIARLGELLLLHGMRRVVVVGGRRELQRLLRDSVDARLEIRAVPANGSPRTRAEAETDVTRSDLVVLWATPMDDGARDVYRSARAVLAEAPKLDLGALIESVEVALREP